MDYITAKELKNQLDNGDDITVLDIREPYELEICQIESLHVPMADVPARIKEIPATGDVVVLCRSGKRAMAVANLLVSDFDRDNVIILDGGILAWIDQVDHQLEAY